MTTDNATLPNFASDIDNDPVVQNAAAERTAPLPGKYYLKFPSTIPPVEVVIRGGQTNVEVLLPMTRIVGNEAGEPIGNDTFDLIGKFYKPSTFRKGNPARSELVDLLTLMSGGAVDIAFLATPDDWNAALAEHVAGQTTPKAVRMTYSGQVSFLDENGKKSYKHPISGKALYPRFRDFKDGDSIARVVYYIDGQYVTKPTFPADVTDNKAKERYAASQGWGVAFSNFLPDFNAFAPEAASK